METQLGESFQMELPKQLYRTELLILELVQDPTNSYMDTASSATSSCSHCVGSGAVATGTHSGEAGTDARQY